MTHRFALLILSAALSLPVSLYAQNEIPEETKAKVYVIATGGTISGGLDPETGQPRSLGAADLVALVPSLDEQVDIEEEDFTPYRKLFDDAGDTVPTRHEGPGVVRAT